MRRSRLLLLAHTMAALVPATASAGCPTGPGLVWADHAAYGVYNTPVASVLARPGTLLGVQNDTWAASYRAAGADTAGWHMQLWNLVGTVKKPKPKSQVLAKIPNLVNLAKRITTCDTPWLTLNEMLTVQSPEPLATSRKRYRANVLALAKGLKARGVRVFLLMPRIPFPKTRYRSYWRNLSFHANLVYEAYAFKSRDVIKRGDAGGRKYLRTRWAEAAKRLKGFVVKPGRAGLMIPYWTHNKNSGREGLSDNAWFRLTKIKTLAATDVGKAQKLGSLWSWGWQTNKNVGEVDPDKPKAACHYLNARDPALCDPSAL
jgi:hypothetical protein